MRSHNLYHEVGVSREVWRVSCSAGTMAFAWCIAFLVFYRNPRKHFRHPSQINRGLPPTGVRLPYIMWLDILPQICCITRIHALVSCYDGKGVNK